MCHAMPCWLGSSHLRGRGCSTGESPRSSSCRRGSGVWRCASAGGRAAAPAPAVPAAQRGPGPPGAAVHLLPATVLPGSPAGREQAGMQAAGAPQKLCSPCTVLLTVPAAHAGILEPERSLAQCCTDTGVALGRTAGAAAPRALEVRGCRAGNAPWQPLCHALPAVPKQAISCLHHGAQTLGELLCHPLCLGGCHREPHVCSANGAARLMWCSVTCPLPCLRGRGRRHMGLRRCSCPGTDGQPGGAPAAEGLSCKVGFPGVYLSQRR